MNIRNLQYGTDAYRSITDQVTTKRQELDHQTSVNVAETKQSQQTNGQDAYIPSPEARRLQEAMDSLEQQRMNRTARDSFTTYDPKSIASGSLRAENTANTTSENTTQPLQTDDNTSSVNTEPELGRNIDYQG